MLNRRQAVRGLAVAAASPLFAVVGCRDAEIGADVRAAMPAEPGALQTLSPVQNATVTALAETILPETDTPGAAALRVNEFVDLVLTEWVSDGDRAALLRAISSLDGLARRNYDTTFADCTAEQQRAMVQDLDTPLVEMAGALREWEEERARAILAAARGAEPPRILEPPSDPSGYAFYQLKRFIMTGYFTSEEGMRQTGFVAIPDRWDGCVEIAADAGSAARARAYEDSGLGRPEPARRQAVDD